MKRLIAIVLIMLLLLSGCRGNEVEDIDTQNSTIVTVDPETAPNTEEPNAPEDSVPEAESTDTPAPQPEDNETTAPDVPETETTIPETQTPEEETSPVPDWGNSTESTEEEKQWTTSCMTFNVLERNTGGSTAFALPATRAPWILDTITKYNPDLLGCQELTKGNTSEENYDMYTYLTTKLEKLGYAWSGLMDSAGKKGSTVAIANYTIGSGLVIFWKKDRFELKDFGAKVYSNDSGRHFQWVKLYDTKEDITILMTNTHMSINPKTGDSAADSVAGDEKRAQQANELYQFWYGNCKDGMALYATGDYNHKTDSPAFANLTRGRFISTREYSQKSNANSGIDHVLVNGDIQDCYEYYRCTETYEPKGQNPTNKHRPSDHYAIITYCSNAYR